MIKYGPYRLGIPGALTGPRLVDMGPPASGVPICKMGRGTVAIHQDHFTHTHTQTALHVCTHMYMHACMQR